MTSINRSNIKTSAALQPSHQYRAVALQILQSDIEKMEYHWNENPMCDFYSKNAVCSALERIIRRNLGSTRLIASEATTQVRIGETICPMNEQVSDWFKSASRGLAVKPQSSIIWLPESLLSRRLLKTKLFQTPLFY